MDVLRGAGSPVRRSSGGRTFRSDITMPREAHSFALPPPQHVFAFAVFEA